MGVRLNTGGINKMKKTKIICTLGPSTDKDGVLEELIKEGMNVARFNFSHGLHDEQKGRIDKLKEIRTRLNKPVAALLDTKGPEIRICEFADGKITLKEGQEFTLTADEIEGNEKIVSVTYKDLYKDVKPGNSILIDDGLIGLEVKKIKGHDIVCTVINGGVLGNKKGVNLPGVEVNMPFISPKDHDDILFGIKEGYDFIAASFTRTAADVKEIRDILEKNGGHDIKIIAKIENQQGVDNIDSIIEAADGIMIARGDLGIEVPAEKIPGIQRVLIRKCVEVKKPVIVATQMLHSMISNPRPTRAEVTDIANAIYYRTDALMLSGETAYGKYPVEAVQTMTKVAREAEKTKLAANDIRVPIEGNDLDVTSFLAKQAVKSSSKLHVKAIITDSYTGRTARYLAAFRGTSTVFSICYNPRVMRMLSLSYGVWAVHQPYNDSRRGYFYDALNELIKSGRITRNDMVAYLSGSFGEGGGTSFLEINNVGKVLDAGSNYQLPTFKE